MHSPIRIPVAHRSRRGQAGKLSVRRSSCCRFFGQDPFGHGKLQCVDALAGGAGDFEVIEAAVGREFAEGLNALGVLGYVHLGGDDDHRLGYQILAETGEFFHHDFEVADGVATAGVGNVHQVGEEAGALDVSQELNSQTVTEVGALDEAGDVGDDESAVAVQLDDAEIRLQV